MNQFDPKAIQSSSSALHPSAEPYLNHYQNHLNDEIDLKELIMALWQEKVTIIIVTVVFAIIAIAYALLAQQWWTSTAKVTIARPQEILAYNQQVTPYKSLFQIEAETADSLFKEFIRIYNSANNKKEFLDNNSEFQAIKAELSSDKELNDDELRVLYNKWFEKINAVVIDPKSNDPATMLSFQAMTKESSYNLLKEYIDVTKNIAVRDTMEELQNIVDIKIQDFEQQKALLETQTKNTLAVEIERTQYALAMAQAAELNAPLQIVNQDSGMFPIGLGAKALEVKLNALKSLKTMEIIEPQFKTVNAKLAILRSLKIDHEVKFQLFRYLADIDYPINRDSPKRALIVILGTLLGGMIGVGIVLIRFAFFKTDKQ